ncbi:MAG: ABC transporter substrate-binding protein [Anaerorhabdus sp.]
MKKLVCLLTAGLLTFGLVACSSSTSSEDGGSTSQFANTLVVGAPELTGSYVDGFGNSAYDKWVKDLIHGYDLYTTDEAGEFVLNETVVDSVETASDSAGNKTYTFTLKDGLTWSDGTPVTAYDYAYQVLLTASSAMVNAGGTFTGLEALLGYADYTSGATNTFSGIKVADDKTISITISAENLPYFFEVSFVAIGLQFPKHVIDADSTITSSDAGVTYEGDLDTVATYVAETYRFNPTVSVGPYTFVSLENNVATVKLNPTFAGDYAGRKPVIETVIVKTVNQTLDADLVIQGAENGGIDMAAGVVEGAKIEKIKASEDAAYTSYYRNGFGFLAFHTDFGASANQNVRQALAYVVDRNAFVQNVVGGYGTIINGEFGLSQWVYQDNQEEIDSSLINYTYNVEKANELLDATEWVYEADGVTPWDPAKAADGYWRYNSAGEVLELVHAGSVENVVTDTISIEIPKGAAQVGIKFTIEQLDFATLLDHYYKGARMGEDRRYNSFNLAVSFVPVNDPYYRIHSDFYGTDINATQTSDAELDALIEALRETDPSDADAFSAKWVEYQIAWNEYLPQIPLYANQYFDVYNSRVSGVETGPDWSWAKAIVNIRLGE